MSSYASPLRLYSSIISLFVHCFTKGPPPLPLHPQQAIMATQKVVTSKQQTKWTLLNLFKIPPKISPSNSQTQKPISTMKQEFLWNWLDKIAKATNLTMIKLELDFPWTKIHKIIITKNLSSQESACFFNNPTMSHYKSSDKMGYEFLTMRGVGTQGQIYVEPWALSEEAPWSKDKSKARKT